MLHGYDSDDSHHRRRGPLRRLWRLITWPFRTVERIESKVVKWFDDRRRNFRHKYRHSKVFAPLVGLIVTIVFAPLRLVWFLLTLPFRFFGRVTSQVGTVRHSREWVHLLQGLPAVVALVGVVTVLTTVIRMGDLPLEYRKRAERAYDAGHYEQAQLYLQRVLQLGADNKETSFLLARTLQQTGQPARSAAILDSLAPDEGGGGYPQAHLLKAASIVRNLDPSKSDIEESLESLRTHLEAAEIDFSHKPEFEYYSGKYFLAAKEHAEAQKEHARSVRDGEGVKRFAKIADECEAEARRHYAVAEPDFQETIKKSPQNQIARIRLAEILIEQEDFEEMAQLLQEGIVQNGDGPFQAVLASGLVRRYKTLPRENPADRLALLQRILELDPQNKEAFNRLMEFGSIGNADPAAEQAARNLLESLITIGESAPLAHFVLGIQAWDRGDSDDALWHMDRAYRLKPDLVVLANAFAWMLVHDARNPDPQRALDVINTVLEEHSDVPDYRETRGQILVRLERWDEALDDLEMALPKFQTSADLHASLAVVYQNLGQPGLAEKHERVATYLREGGSDAAGPR